MKDLQTTAVAVVAALMLFSTTHVMAGSAVPFLTYRGGYSELGSLLGVACLAAGDIDGDGHTEILVSGTTQTFGGPGLFSILRADPLSPAGYRQIAFSDAFDAGLTTANLLDLHANGSRSVVVGLGDGSVRVYEGTALVQVASANVGDSVNQVLLADPDGDGIVDLVVLSASSITLLDPSTLQSRGSISQGAAEMAVGDIDGDGHPEVVLNTGKVLRLSRTGLTISAQTLWTYPAGNFGIHIALADIDQDGKEELIAESDWDYLTAFDLELQSPKWQINGLGDLDAMTLADVNGDGVLDAIIGSGQSGSETAIDLTNRQTLWSVPNPNSGTGHVLVADIDGDGHSELLWTGGYNDTGPDNLFVYALPALTEKWRSLHVDGPFDAIAVQPSGNGIATPRVAFSSSFSNSQYGDGIVTQWNASTLAPLTTTAPNTFHSNAWTGIHALAYGHGRLYVGTDNLYDGALYGLDVATGVLQYEHLYDSGSPLNALAVADLDNDGHDEIVAGDYGEHTGSPGVYVYVFDEASGVEQWRSISLAPTFGGVRSLGVADLDGDGVKDIAAVVVAGGSSGHLFQFMGSAHQQWESGQANYTSLSTFDVDGDGVAEVLVGTDAGSVQALNAQTHAIVWTLVVGSGPVAAVRAYRDPGTGRLRVASLVDDQLRVNDVLTGAAVAAAQHVIKGTRALEVLDADGDGQMDFFVGGEAAFRVYRLFNDAIFANGFE